MKYIIHACDRRMWYVEEFLIPSMKEQGIKYIEIDEDTEHQGCLFSAIKSFEHCGRNRISAWHIQDDVVLSRDFAEKSQNIDFNGVIMGFWHRFDGDKELHPGKTRVSEMTYSFPCIYIPWEIAGGYAEWFNSEAMYREEYRRWIAARKFGDSFFRDFMQEKHGSEYVFNMKPSIVDHIDWLIGGSVINQYRSGICRAEYWEDENIIEELKDKLAHRK